MMPQIILLKLTFINAARNPPLLAESEAII
jgi:hypothetical protein